MCDLEERSIWVSNLRPPISTRALTSHFNSVGQIEEIIIPTEHQDCCLIIFATEETALNALRMDSTFFDSGVIHLKEPTLAQLSLVLNMEIDRKEPVASTLESVTDAAQQLSNRDILSLVQSLTEIAESRVTMETPFQDPRSQQHGGTSTRTPECTRKWTTLPSATSYRPLDTPYDHPQGAVGFGPQMA